MLGLANYLVALLTMGALYAILCLGLNLQWGFAGLFNAGIAGFFAVGAYSAAILTSPPSPNFLGGFDLPFAPAWIVAMVLSGAVAYAIGRASLRLSGDYLAMATIGIAEVLRLVFKNEEWLTAGTRGIPSVPRPFDGMAPLPGGVSYLLIILALLMLAYWAVERAWVSPWGRALRAIRDSEVSAAAIGKDVAHFRLEAFVLGGMLMGLAGALSAHYFKFIGVGATEPLMTTFLVWVMLIVGGSGNNRGAILGAFLIWTIWSVTELFTNRLPGEWITRTSYLRVLLIGIVLQIVLQRFAKGILPERPPRSNAD